MPNCKIHFKIKPQLLWADTGFKVSCSLKKMVSVPFIFLRHMLPAVGAAPEHVQSNVTLLLYNFNLAYKFTNFFVSFKILNRL